MEIFRRPDVMDKTQGENPPLTLGDFMQTSNQQQYLEKFQ
jgi:hypothetical protein